MSCPVCGTDLPQNAHHRRVYCGDACSMTARLERKRTTYRNPEEKARQLVRLKIRGKVTRQPCAVCGSELSEAHHPDYNFPLEVEWYCRRHHSQLHAEMRRSG